jgi:hypothetical protein
MVDLDPSVGAHETGGLLATGRSATCFCCPCFTVLCVESGGGGGGGRGGHSTLLKAWVIVQYVCMFCPSNNVARGSCLVMVLGLRG